MLPTELEEVISVTSAIAPRWRSSGVATVVAITSGLAPGMDAETVIVAVSTCGKRGDRELQVGDCAGEHDPGREQGRGHRPADEDLGDVHVVGLRWRRQPRRPASRNRTAIRSNAR